MEPIRSAFDRPLLTYRVLVPVLVIFWFVSSVGQSDDQAASESDWAWIGTIGWVLFGVAFLITALFTIVLLARRILRRGATT